MEISRLGSDHVERVVAASPLFDEPARPEWARRFLTSPGHHLLVATLDGVDVGFVTGVEMTHPDKGTEMFLYELGVEEAARGQGIGRALVDALAAIAVQSGCCAMWVETDADNEAALATYRGSGAGEPSPVVMLEWRF